MIGYDLREAIVRLLNSTTKLVDRAIELIEKKIEKENQR